MPPANMSNFSTNFSPSVDRINPTPSVDAQTNSVLPDWWVKSAPSSESKPSGFQLNQSVETKSGARPLFKSAQKEIRFNDPIETQKRQLSRELESWKQNETTTLEDREKQVLPLLGQVENPAIAKPTSEKSEAKTPKSQVIEAKAESVIGFLGGFFSIISKIFNEIKGALTDGYKEFVGFKVLTPDQQKKKQEQEAKTKAKAENIKMSYSKQQEAKATAMAAIREDLAKKAETHGVIGMSHDQQNELLGRGWNQSHEGEKSWYHIAAIGARIQEKRAEELRAAKAQKSAAAGKGEKKNWFLDKNTAHSRVGGNYQSAPS